MEEKLAAMFQDAFTVQEFCLRHRISQRTYARMKRAGRGPREMVISKRDIIITKEAAAEWRIGSPRFDPGQISPTDDGDVA